MKKSTYILGISCYYHDAAACLLKDGELIAAAQEERFTRKKHDENFPNKAIEYCLKEAGITREQITHVAFYEKPFLKFERLLETYIGTWPFGVRSFIMSMRTWLTKKLWIDSLIKKELDWKSDIFYVPHHMSHAASTFYTSEYKNAAVITIDGVGEWSTSTIGHGSGNKLTIDKEVKFPHSLGLFYSAFTYYLGFKVNSAEYKVMGLAPYGKPKYVEQIRELITLHDDGSFSLKMKYFAYEYDLKMITAAFSKHFNEPVRNPDDPLTQFHKDMAASLQIVTEEAVLNMVAHARKLYKTDSLCLAGGVALNCVANGRILRESGFKHVYIFPAAGDAGGAVGAAYYLYHDLLGHDDRHAMVHPYLGPKYETDEIEKFLNEKKIKHHRYSESEAPEKIADELVANKVIGLFQGRMEFGPRALGNRSIIADPRVQENWQRVNLKIKFRESFRPFAPAVLEEKLSEVYELDVPSPHMLFVAQAKKAYPAVTHVDNSARIQSVNREQNADFYNIIAAFDKRTGCPVVINTSFNVRGEPIVCDYVDAIKGFLRTDMDVLVLNTILIQASEIDKKEVAKHFTFETFERD